MSQMVNGQGFIEDDFQQNLDTLRLQEKADDVIQRLDEYIQQEYGGQVESALLTRSGHYGMSLMADSALMKQKYGHNPEAQEVADLDLCITVSNDIQEDIPEIRDLFKKEDGTYGSFNQEYEEVEINPRILHEGGLIGKLEKAAEEWRKSIPESVNFPDVDGTETSRHPAEFMGYFHQGYESIKQTESLQDSLNYIGDVITDECGEVYEELWSDVWEGFRSRMRFKPGLMNKNAELGKLEMAKTNAESLDYQRDSYRDENSGNVKMEERNIGDVNLTQKLKDELAEEEELLEWFSGESPGDVEPKSTGQQALNLENGPEPEVEPDKELVRRRVQRFLEEHPDLDRTSQEKGYEFSFGGEPLTDYFGEDFKYEMAEGAVKSVLGRKLATQKSKDKNNMSDAQLSDF